MVDRWRLDHLGAVKGNLPFTHGSSLATKRVGSSSELNSADLSATLLANELTRNPPLKLTEEYREIALKSVVKPGACRKAVTTSPVVTPSSFLTVSWRVDVGSPPVQAAGYEAVTCIIGGWQISILCKLEVSESAKMIRGSRKDRTASLWPLQVSTQTAAYLTMPMLLYLSDTYADSSRG